MSGSTRLDSMDWKTGQRILDHYVVRKILGRGGNGTVYLVEAEDRPEARFAVKTLRYQRGKLSRNREVLLGELQAWSDIPPHPNIVTCRFFRTIEETPVIFSEYVDGGTLNYWILHEKISNLTELLDIAIQIVEGLRIAHARGLIHQDIKPANIMMTSEGCAKITDFGLAFNRMDGAEALSGSGGVTKSSSDTKKTYKGMTPVYCSPEQATREPVDHRTDIWSWALVVIEMLRRDAPPWTQGSVAGCWFESAAITEIHTAFRSPVATELWRLLGQCLEENPSARVENCDVLQQRLLELYCLAASADYPRRILNIAPRMKSGPVNLHRKTIYNGTSWESPGFYLAEVSRLIGVNPDTQLRIPPACGNSRRVCMLAEARGFQRVLAWMDGVRSYVRNPAVDFLAVRCLIDCSQVFFELEDPPGADQVLVKAIEILGTDDSRGGSDFWKELLVKAAINLSESYRLTGKYDAAEALLKKVGEETGGSEESGWTVQNSSDDSDRRFQVLQLRLRKAWGNLFFSQQNSDKALETFRKAYPLFDGLTEKDFPNLQISRCMCLQAIATALGLSGRPAEARQHMEQAVELSSTWDGSESHYAYCQAVIHANMGNILNKINHSDALMHFQKAVELAFGDATGDIRFTRLLCRAMLSKAAFYSRNYQYPDTLATLKQLHNLLEDQIYLHGRTELLLEMLAVTNNLVAVLCKLDRYNDAIKVIHFGCRLAEHLQRGEKRDDVAWIESVLKFNLVCAYRETDRCVEALEEIERIIVQRENSITTENRKHSTPAAANAVVMKASILMMLGRFSEALETSKWAIRHCETIDNLANWDHMVIKIRCLETHFECLSAMNLMDDLGRAVDEFQEDLDRFNQTNERPIAEVHRCGPDLYKALILVRQGNRDEGIALARKIADVVTDEKNRMSPGIDKKIEMVRRILGGAP